MIPIMEKSWKIWPMRSIRFCVYVLSCLKLFEKEEIFHMNLSVGIKLASFVKLTLNQILHHVSYWVGKGLLLDILHQINLLLTSLVKGWRRYSDN